LRALNGVERGALVALQRATPDLKPADRTILEIAGEDGLYSAALHRAQVPSDRDAYIEMHVRRLEALRREGIVQRTADGAFHLPADYEQRVLAREGRGGRERAEVTMLDPHTVERQAGYEGPTWLDRVAEGIEDRGQLRAAGFGRQVHAALVQRDETLKALGLAQEDGRDLVLAPDWQDRLRGMEQDRLRERIERDTGRVPHFARDGERVHGVFVSRVHAAEQSYALIVQDRTATLAPWRPEMDRALNQFVSGHVNGREFDFKYGREPEKALKLAKGLDLGR
jgi:hypothetical protein